MVATKEGYNMKMRIMTKEVNMDNRPLEREALFDANDNLYAILKANLGSCIKDNAILSMDDDFLSHLGKGRSRVAPSRKKGTIYFSKDLEECIKYEWEKDRRSYVIRYAKLGDVEYKGACFTTDICEIKLRTNLKRTFARL